LFKEVFGRIPDGLEIPGSSLELLKRFQRALRPHLLKAQVALKLAADEERARTELERFDSDQAQQRQALLDTFQQAQSRSRAHAENG
jgi:hypothetical protein